MLQSIRIYCRHKRAAISATVQHTHSSWQSLSIRFSLYFNSFCLQVSSLSFIPAKSYQWEAFSSGGSAHSHFSLQIRRKIHSHRWSNFDSIVMQSQLLCKEKQTKSVEVCEREKTTREKQEATKTAIFREMVSAKNRLQPYSISSFNELGARSRAFTHTHKKKTLFTLSDA